MGGLSETGLETAATDRQRELIGPGFSAPPLPDAAVFDKIAARRAHEDGMRGHHGTVARKRLKPNVEVER